MSTISCTFPCFQNVAEILNIYENEFNKLSDRYFVELPWPDTEMIAPLIEKGLYIMSLLHIYLPQFV